MVITIDISPEDFLAYAEACPDKRFDFIDGEIVEVSPKPIHGRIQILLAHLLTLWLEKNPLGVVHSEVLHVLRGKKFIPDISINQPNDDADYFTDPPLLVVEIKSDSQSEEAQRRKARDYLTRGVPLVWLVFPGRGIETWRAGHDPVVLRSGDSLTGDDVLPGFSVGVDRVIGKVTD